MNADLIRVHPRKSAAKTLFRLLVVVVIAWPLLAWVAARALIVKAEGTANADAIVVLSNTDYLEERSRRAAELLSAGRAPKIVLTNENQISRWSESKQRNLYTYEWEKDVLNRAGVSDEKIEVLLEPVTSTYSEAVRLLDYAGKKQLKSLVIVTSAYHSRRALWTFRKVFDDSGIDISLEPVAAGQQTPQPMFWWLQPSGWKVVATEYPKLIYYWARYRSPKIDNTENLPRFSGPEVKTTVGSNQAGMALSIAAPVSAFTNEVVLIDARKSTGVPNKPQSDGTPSVTIDFGDGFTCNLLASGHAYRKAGTYTITVSAKNKGGATGAPVTATITVMDIPAAPAVIDMTSASGNAAFYILSNNYKSAGANAKKLQAAINLAASRNTAEQEIVLPAGAVFAGPIILPTPMGGKYITIRSGSLGSLPAGQRVGPDTGNLMPVITSPSSTNNILAAMWTTNPTPANPAHHYRIQGIHFRKDSEAQHSQSLMSIGDVNPGQNRISMLPYNFILDRCWFDGGSSDTSQATNGLRIAANAVSLVDSYLGEFRLIGAGVDAAAISLSKGQGPYAFINNTMIATSENFNIAGGPAERNTATISNATNTSCTLSSVANLELDQNIALPVGGSYTALHTTVVRSISGNNITYDALAATPDNGGTAEWIATPSYIEFRGNYLYKPLKWRPKDPAWNGITYQIKNLWETKFSRYVVVDGNVLQNSWVQDQSYSITLTVANVTGGESAATVVRELQFSNNIIRNVGNGVSIMPKGVTGPTQLASDITFRNNLFWNCGPNWDPNGNMMVNLLSSGNPAIKSKRIFLIHNTHDNPIPFGTITDFGASNSGSGAVESMWMNNVHGHGAWGFRSNNTNENQAANITEFLPTGSPTSWNRNLIINPAQWTIFPPTAILVNGAYRAQFVDYANGDFTLAKGSPGKGKALDGKDVGVDMSSLRAATAGAIDGRGGKVPTANEQPTTTRPRVVKERPH